MDILRLKSLLVEKGITGKDLAERVDVSAVAISNISSGNSFPKPELLKKIADELDVDISELFNKTKETHDQPIFIKEGGNFIQIGSINLKK